MALATSNKETQRLLRRLQKGAEDRIRQLSAEARSDFAALCQMLVSDDEENRFDIAKAIVEIVWPEVTAVNGPQDSKEDVAEARRRVADYRRCVGRAIRKRRDELGWTQAELSKRCGLPQSHISRLERGKHAATFTTMERLARALKTSVAQLDPGFPSND
jgi:ribosome-binding protein aMBF1 (putative translation factor)